MYVEEVNHQGHSIDLRVNELGRSISAKDVNHHEIGTDQRVCELVVKMSVEELNHLGNDIAILDHTTTGNNTLTLFSGENGQTLAETPNIMRNIKSPRKNVEA
ncbi:hypothetical protein ACFE04_030215 [Oxalis oulophora]